MTLILLCSLSVLSNVLCPQQENRYLLMPLYKSFPPEPSQLLKLLGTSLVVQWLRIRLPMQGTRVQALVREDLTCRGATKPMRYNY